jgi:hypothetical protein
MVNRFQQHVRLFPPTVIWLLGFLTITVAGWSLVVDLNGVSTADEFIVTRWSFAGLRIYLWLEGGLMAALVAAVGVHVASIGFAITRGRHSSPFGILPDLCRRIPAPSGYIFVVLGAALVALSLTTLVALNSCRYMRLA